MGYTAAQATRGKRTEGRVDSDSTATDESMGEMVNRVAMLQVERQRELGTGDHVIDGAMHGVFDTGLLTFPLGYDISI